MDFFVAKEYGWDDIKLEHGFRETKYGFRFSISENAEKEILKRLLQLNDQRHKEYRAQQSFKGEPVSGRRRLRVVESSQPMKDLFGDNDL